MLIKRNTRPLSLNEFQNFYKLYQGQIVKLMLVPKGEKVVTDLENI